MLKKSLTVVLLVLFSGSLMYSKIKRLPEIELPKRIKIISQSSAQTYTKISAIDLSDNTLIILVVSSTGSYYCYSTGIKIDPKTQPFVQGQSSPTDDD